MSTDCSLVWVWEYISVWLSLLVDHIGSWMIGIVLLLCWYFSSYLYDLGSGEANHVSKSTRINPGISQDFHSLFISHSLICLPTVSLFIYLFCLLIIQVPVVLLPTLKGEHKKLPFLLASFLPTPVFTVPLCLQYLFWVRNMSLTEV